MRFLRQVFILRAEFDRAQWMCKSRAWSPEFSAGAFGKSPVAASSIPFEAGVIRAPFGWSALGGPAVREPTRRSFGARLPGALAVQLHGEVRLRYEPAGVVDDLNIPLALLGAVQLG